jgi:ABC-type uncharacterized transport system substrate-binding protein
VKRRELITLLGGAAAWPLAARAQLRPTIGYLDIGSFEKRRNIVADVQRGLSEIGYIEGKNLTIEYRWASEDSLHRLPDLARDLLGRQVAVIIALQTPSALAAKGATKSIPIVFETAVNPVEAGLVASLNRPGGNLTGITSLVVEVAAKRLELLHELRPSAALFAYLLNPLLAPPFNEAEMRELQTAAQKLGLRLLIVNSGTPNEFDAAFATTASSGAAGLIVSGAQFFSDNADRLVALAAPHGVPTVYGRRDLTLAGGLMSYGTDFSGLFRQVGVYTGRILNGEKPADLTVQQVTKLQLAINLKTAKSLGLAFPTALLVRADEVIE